MADAEKKQPAIDEKKPILDKNGKPIKIKEEELVLSFHFLTCIPIRLKKTFN
jgi:hypothetical protein